MAGYEVQDGAREPGQWESGRDDVAFVDVCFTVCIPLAAVIVSTVRKSRAMRTYRACSR